MMQVMASSGIDPAPSILGPFRLKVFLRQGRDLAARDACGNKQSVLQRDFPIQGQIDWTILTGSILVLISCTRLEVNRNEKE